MKTMPELVQSVMQSLPPITARDGSLIRECCQCGAPIECYTPEAKRALDVTCPACLAQRHSAEARIMQEARERRRNLLMGVVPPAFLETDRNKLPKPEMLENAMDLWLGSSKGLLLYGATGTGKTRVAWEIVKREIQAGRSVKTVNAFELAKYPGLFAAGRSE